MKPMSTMTAARPRRYVVTPLIVVLAFAVAAPVSAHHGTAPRYDFSDPITIEGEVTTVFWRNPHVILTLAIVGESGEPEVWEVEAGSMNALERIGYGADTIRPGDRVVLTGGRSRLGLPTMAVVTATLPDGSEVPLWPQRAAALGLGAERAQIESAAVAASTERARGIFRVWGRRGGYDRSVSYTPEAQAARDQWSLLDDDPALDCIPPGMPAMMNNPYPIEFVDEGDQILLRLEEWDGRRVIHLDDDADVDSQPATPTGYSVGVWEGDTLVVATSRVDYPYHDDRGTPQSDDSVILERFSVADDGNRLDYSAVITDPRNLAEPMTIDGYWTWVPGEEIKRYDCTLPSD